MSSLRSEQPSLGDQLRAEASGVQEQLTDELLTAAEPYAATKPKRLSQVASLFFKLSLTQHTLPAVYTVVFWWLSTALIIYFNFQPALRTALFVSSFGFASLALWMLVRFRNETSVRASYLTFTAGSLLWAFVEVSFYTGFIVGPPLRPIFSIGPSMETFFRAVHQSLYHELLVLGLATSLAVFSWRAKNKFGFYTFLLFWLMHQSTKLNVFFGVANINRDFIPEPVSAIAQYMTIASMNWLFPISITVCTIVSYRLLRRVHESTAAWQKVGYVLIGMMSLLALLEHWLLVLPLDKTLWDIAIKRFH
ncbi:MAG: DUF3623 family protein [Rhizobacter sp.]|nr:DUF3623 family protein [Chlorobiales bacterium]